MTHPVLTDVDVGTPVVLHHADATTTETTGKMMRADESEGLADAPGRRVIMVPAPDSESRVRVITAGSERWDVLEHEPYAGGLLSPAFADFASVRYFVRAATAGG